MCTMALTGPRIRVTTADAEGWVTVDACHGFAWVDGEHDLTADVLYWVLSPGWSGGVEGDVPMPDRAPAVALSRRSPGPRRRGRGRRG